jgi:hypothetical protein
MFLEKSCKFTRFPHIFEEKSRKTYLFTFEKSVLLPRESILLTLKNLIMKKALVIIACIAFVGALTSCSKECTCKTYKDGKVTATNTYKIDKDSDKKCSDYAVTAIYDNGNGKNGIECK